MATLIVIISKKGNTVRAVFMSCTVQYMMTHSTVFTIIASVRITVMTDTLNGLSIDFLGVVVVMYRSEHNIHQTLKLQNQ